MASSDWLEVQRLAAEFQRAQLTTALQKLSERNCIEIVTKLIDLKLIDVFYTNDGKEYVTPQQLSKEMCDELYLHGGRLGLTELVSILNVGLHAVEAQAHEIVQSQPEIHLVSGQLIDDTYLDRVAEEINEALQQNGQIVLVELTKQYELPIEFLLQQLVSRLGTVIQGQQDKHDHHVFYTEGYLARIKARVRGCLSAITVPTSISSIMAHNKFPERFFFAVVDELIHSKRIKGSLSGGRQANVATFIPDIYSRSQSEWIDSFLKQNGYLEYDALTRLGLADPKGHCRKRFKETPLLYLSTCCVANDILEQVEAAIEEALSSQSWVEIMPLLPSVFNEEDAEQIIRHVLKNSSNSLFKDSLTIGPSAVTSQSFVNNLKPIFDPLIAKKAQDVVTSGAYLQAQADQRSAKMKGQTGKLPVEEKQKDRKEERRKKAAEGKAGGGTQGRETKTKTTKKKYLKGRGGNDSDEDEEDNHGGGSMASSSGNSNFEIEFMTVDDIGKVIKKEESMTDATDEFIAEIAARLYKPLQSTFQEAARSAFEALLASSSGQRRQTHGELQDRLQVLLNNIKQGEKALQHFGSLDIQQQLTRHLLKSSGSELINELILYVAQDLNINLTDSKDQISPEARQKLIGELAPNVRPALLALHKAAGGASVEDFLTQSEAALTACDIILKKVDKKKDKSAGSQQRQGLIEQLSNASDPALVLHLAVLLLFHTVTQTVLNASGRFVPQIVAFLQPQLPAATADLLTTFQGLVIQELTSKGDEELAASVRQKMEELVPSVREAAVSFKLKPGSSAVQD